MILTTAHGVCVGGGGGYSHMKRCTVLLLLGFFLKPFNISATVKFEVKLDIFELHLFFLAFLH